MAGQQRNMEGSAEQRRAAARAAKQQGKRPSEMSATTGASKQTKSAKKNASHSSKVAQKREGKASTPGTSGKPRPGDRDRDPKRTDRWS